MRRPIAFQVRPTHEMHGTTKFLLVEFWTGGEYEEPTLLTSVAWNKSSFGLPDRGQAWQGAFGDRRFFPMLRYLESVLPRNPPTGYSSELWP